MYARPIAPADSPSSRVANRISTATCMWCRICHRPASSASASSVRLFQTSVRPSWISAATDAPARGCGTSCAEPIRRSIAAEAKNVSASSTIANGAVTSWISPPASPGPTSAADVSPRATLAFASTSRLRPAICASSTW